MLICFDDEDENEVKTSLLPNEKDEGNGVVLVFILIEASATLST